jgi:hypothetical protein
MRRLQRTFLAELRSMQMSSVSLFVFTEGHNADPNFYGSVCSSVPEAVLKYEIRSADRLSGASGGKTILLNFFELLRSRKCLIGEFKGKKTAALFFLDKDLDDIRHTRRRSPHVVYTEFYDVENHVFEHGDLARAAAAAASVDPQLLTRLEGSHSWCERTSHLWREWIVICMWALEAGTACPARYAVHSTIQTRPCGPTDLAKRQQLLKDAAVLTGLPVGTIETQLAEVSRRVDRYLHDGRHHRVFKGKWFSRVLADQIDQLVQGRRYAKSGLSSRIPGALASTLDYEQPWADRFKDPVRRIAAQL